MQFFGPGYAAKKRLQRHTELHGVASLSQLFTQGMDQTPLLPSPDADLRVPSLHKLEMEDLINIVARAQSPQHTILTCKRFYLATLRTRRHLVLSAYRETLLQDALAGEWVETYEVKSRRYGSRFPCRFLTCTAELLVPIVWSRFSNLRDLRFAGPLHYWGGLGATWSCAWPETLPLRLLEMSRFIFPDGRFPIPDSLKLLEEIRLDRVIVARDELLEFLRSCPMLARVHVSSVGVDPLSVAALPQLREAVLLRCDGEWPEDVEYLRAGAQLARLKLESSEALHAAQTSALIKFLTGTEDMDLDLDLEQVPLTVLQGFAAAAAGVRRLSIGANAMQLLPCFPQVRTVLVRVKHANRDDLEEQELALGRAVAACPDLASLTISQTARTSVSSASAFSQTSCRHRLP